MFNWQLFHSNKENLRKKRKQEEEFKCWVLKTKRKMFNNEVFPFNDYEILHTPLDLYASDGEVLVHNLTTDIPVYACWAAVTMLFLFLIFYLASASSVINVSFVLFSLEEKLWSKTKIGQGFPSAIFCSGGYERQNCSSLANFVFAIF